MQRKAFRPLYPTRSVSHLVLTKNISDTFLQQLPLFVHFNLILSPPEFFLVSSWTVTRFTALRLLYAQQIFPA